jgi:hypothetical protein
VKRPALISSLSVPEAWRFAAWAQQCEGMLSCKAAAILVSLFLWLIALSAAQPSYASNCDLAQAVERHQRLDDFLNEKFGHYWWITDYRAGRLADIVRDLPPGTAILFHAIPDLGSPHNSVSERRPQFLCAWLIDGQRTVTDVEIVLSAEDSLALLDLAADVMLSLAHDDRSRGWIGPEATKRVLPTTSKRATPPP